MLLKEKNMVVSLLQIRPTMTCVSEGCVYGWEAISPSFSKVLLENESPSPLKLMHVDICGPTQTPTIGNMRYLLTSL